MKRFCFLLLITTIGFGFQLDAQSKRGSKVQGYIIDNNGKRINGTIIVGDWADNQVQVKFIKRGSSKKEVYKPTQLKGFAFQDDYVNEIGKKDKRWVEYDTRQADRPSRIFGSTTVFMHKEVTEGKLKLYCYYIEVRNNAAKNYDYYFFVEDDKGNFTKVSEEGFKSKARELFKDYGALRQRLGSKDFRLKNMDRMIRDYNYWVTNKHNPNEYRVAMKN